MNIPDIVAVCVSDPTQAERFGQAIRRRQSLGLYPWEINFAVVHDPPKGRIGSGGGTIHALAQLRSRFPDTVDQASILLIHAGGESRRLPAYAPEGKLFAPIPVPSDSVIPPVLLDAQLGLYLRYPWRDAELVVASGDVYIDFDERSVRRDRGAICGFAVPADYEEGSHHGVFSFDRTGRRVVDYLQKVPVDVLRRQASLAGGQACALDIGIVAFHGEGRDRLRKAEAQLGAALAQGALHIDLYVEIMTAALSGIDRAGFEQRVSSLSRLSPADRNMMFDLFQGLELNGVLARSSVFLHFGSLSDVPSTALDLIGGSVGRSGTALPFYDVARSAGLRHESVPQVLGTLVAANCIGTELGTSSEEPSYVEGCRNLSLRRMEGGNLVVGLSSLDFGSWSLPRGFCLDGRRLTPSGVVVGTAADGAAAAAAASAVAARTVVAVYHRDDSFKSVKSLADARFCGQALAAWLAARGLTPQDIDPALRDGSPIDLWELPLFWENPAAGDIQGFVDSTLADAAWRDKFRALPRRSLRFLHDQADLVQREADREDIRAELIRDSILSGLGWQALPASEMRRVFNAEADRPALEALAVAEQDDLIAVYRRHCLASLSGLSSRTVSTIAVEYLSSLTTPPPLRRSVKSDQIVWARSPVRMDFGGGWTDTPPYTLREGGRVTNVAIDLNGQAPIQVFCRPLDKPVVRFHSIDLGEGEEIRSFQALEDYTNPMVPFALPRAALCILGFTQACYPGKTLGDALGALGGGVEVTLLSAIPKGSGLGVSSILGATVLAALERFFGVFDPDHGDTGELYRQVLQMEQMLTTGGGWQDQIGGVAGGIKYLVGTAGLRPELAVYRLDPHLFLDPEYTDRYTLFYTGVTRLAKNILQEVVDQCNSMSPAYLFTLRRIGALADAAREAFALRDVDRFAKIVEMSWMENCLIHPSTTNPEISAMRKAVSPYYRGMKLLGAGGGGYGFFVSDNAESALRLREALEAWSISAGNPRARVIDMALNQAGLQVTVS